MAYSWRSEEEVYSSSFEIKEERFVYVDYVFFKTTQGQQLSYVVLLIDEGNMQFSEGPVTERYTASQLMQLVQQSLFRKFTNTS